MTLTTTIILIVALDVALLALLACVMSLPSQLEPHPRAPARAASPDRRRVPARRVRREATPLRPVLDR